MQYYISKANGEYKEAKETSLLAVIGEAEADAVEETYPIRIAQFDGSLQYLQGIRLTSVSPWDIF